MPNYSLNHIHHEAENVEQAIEFYKKMFQAAVNEPVERDGVLWAFVHIGDIKITITNRESSHTELGRNRGIDHLALTTDDFDRTLEIIQQERVNIWLGPLTQQNGQRLVFVSGPDNVKIELMEKI